MDERNYWARAGAHRISRRGALRGAGITLAGLAGAALIGCGDDDDDDATTSTATQDPGATSTPTATADPDAVKRGGTFRQMTITVAPHFSTLHPGADPSYINTFRRQSYYRRLWHQIDTPDPEKQIRLDLAREIERPDETTVIVKTYNSPWQDQRESESNDAVGQRPYDAEDTVERIKFMQSVADTNAAVSAFLVDSLSSVEAIDESTIRFETNEPAAFFMEDDEGAAFRSEEIPREMLDETVLRNHVPIGNGPWMYDAGRTASFEEARPNPTYEDPDDLGRPYIDKRKLTFVPDSIAREVAFRTGQIDHTSFTDVRQADTVVGDLGDSVRRVTYPTTSGQALIVNMRRDPWKDERARRAVHLALDVERVINVVYFGDAERSWYFPPARSDRFPLGYDGVKDIIKYDPAEATKLVAAVKSAGAYDGSELSMFLPVEAQTWVDAGTLQIEDLNAVGFNVVSEPLPRNIYLGRSGSKPEDVTASSDFDISMTVFLGYSFQSSKNRHFWNNTSLDDPEVDDILDQIAVTVDAEERAELSHRFERMLAEKSSNFVPILTGNVHGAFYDYVKGIDHEIAFDGVSNTLYQHDLWLDA